MTSSCESFISLSSKLSCSPTATAVATAFDYALQQCVKNFKELLSEHERVLKNLENSKNEVSKLKSLCESKCCNGAEDLQKVIVNKEKDIATKDNIISLIASAITQFKDTRDWSYIDTIFLLFEGTNKTTPPKINTSTDILHDTNSVASKTNSVKLTYDSGTPKKVKSAVSTPKKAANDLSTPKKAIKKEKITPVKEIKQPSLQLSRKTPKLEKKSPEQEINKSNTDPCSSIEDISFKEESLSEIDVTPRAKSPIVKSKNRRGPTTSSLLGNPSQISGVRDTSDSDVREKKKCPDGWKRSPAKHHLVSFLNTSKKAPCGGVKGKKLVQQRFQRDSFVKVTNFVDLTNSPECSKDSRDGLEGAVKRLIKKESSENDETILPSPTSNPSEFIVSRNLKEKEIQSKSKRPLSLKHKTEPMDCNDDQIDIKNQPLDSRNQPIDSRNQPIDSKNQSIDCKEKPEPPKDSKVQPIATKLPPINTELIASKIHQVEYNVHKADSKIHKVVAQVQPIDEKSQIVSFVEPKIRIEDHHLEKSINILNPIRYNSPIKSQSTLDQLQVPMDILDDYDVTKCDTLLNIGDPEPECKENIGLDNNPSLVGFISPTKRPLAENKNIPNEADSSMSLLGGNKSKELGHPSKRKTSEKVEPIYKEPTVRKKNDKMALPAWLCEECKAFISALYDDPDPAKVQAIISRCGKHRGKNNPVRPATPPGFWAPRWSVASDTDQFNRDNNA